MLTRLPNQYRLAALWAVFLVVAILTGLVVFHLYDTAREQIRLQGEHALTQARTEALERIHVSTVDVRNSILTDLAGFHVDGLAATLQQWDTANEIILGTFQADAKHPSPDENPGVPGAPTGDELAAIWKECYEWRKNQPTQVVREPVTVGRFSVVEAATMGNALYPEGTFHFQSENADLAAEAGNTVDPWAGFVASTKGDDSPWVVWYTMGPDSPVRGCFVDQKLVLQQLRSELQSSDLATLRILPTSLASSEVGTPLKDLPGYALVADMGQAYRLKAADTRLTAAVAALLLLVFLAGGSALVWHTRREARAAANKIHFVTQVSHEFRTPLTSIRMFADLLENKELSEEKRLRYARTISGESERLGRLIERLLAFSSVQRGKQVKQVPIEVVPLITAVLEEMAPQMGNAGLEAQLEPVKDIPRALGDASSFKQAFLNLIENACKYASGSGTLAVSVEVLQRGVAVRVTDKGPGIPAHVRQRLFEPFVQGGQTLTTKSPGVGLGLSLSRGLLRQAGGDLRHVPTETGTVFEILLNTVTPPIETQQP